MFISAALGNLCLMLAVVMGDSMPDRKVYV